MWLSSKDLQFFSLFAWCSSHTTVSIFLNYGRWNTSIPEFKELKHEKTTVDSAKKYKQKY